MKPYGMRKGKLFVSVVSIAMLVFLFACRNGVEPEAAEIRSERPEMTGFAADEQQSDFGKQPWVVDIEKGTIENSAYRKVAWTGDYLQMVFMSLKPGEEIQLEIHDDHDQFIRIEQGEARVEMGEVMDALTYVEEVSDDWAIFIPAGFWHRITNAGNVDLKLYTIYAPPEHPMGLVHESVVR
jgi:mannose-6-phosphate isomerase-like protein (cupin superfamily)